MGFLGIYVRSFCSLLCTLIITCASWAQVVYVNVEPNVVLNQSSTTYVIENPFGGENITLENEGFYSFQGNTPQPSIGTMPGGFSVDLLQCGDLIQESDNWWFSGNEFLNQTGDYYARLVFMDLLDQPHYSWFRFNYNTASQTLIVLDYAYELAPNTSILTCDTGNGIPLVEICDNSIDDDLDGQIDFLDSDCPCSSNDNQTNLVVNSDLESIHSLPTGVSALDFSLVGFSQFSLATPDYFRIGSYYPDVLPDPHSGFGICGSIWANHLDWDGNTFNPQYQESFLIDISEPLLENTNYQFSFFNANMLIQNAIGVCGEGLTPNESILPIDDLLTFVLYGNSGNLELPYPDGFCPLEMEDEWVVLGSTQFEYHENWQQSIIEFTSPPSGVDNILLGFPCEAPNSLNVSDSTCLPYFVFDDFSLVLNEAPSNEEVEITESLSDCFSTHFLSLTSNFLHEQVIWKFNGEVLENQISDTLNISELNLESGIYSVEIRGISGCAEASIVIDDVQQPQAFFNAITTTNSSIVSFEGIDFSGEISDWQWFFGDGSSASSQYVTHDYSNPGVYEVTLVYTDSFGCVGQLNNSVVISYSQYVYLPNSFTPNHDGVNEQWAWQTNNVLDIEVLIWNRWGELIFKSTDLNGYWDGSVNNGNHYSLNGIYPYIFRFKNEKGLWQELNGNILIMR